MGAGAFTRALAGLWITSLAAGCYQSGEPARDQPDASSVVDSRDDGDSAAARDAPDRDGTGGLASGGQPGGDAPTDAGPRGGPLDAALRDEDGGMACAPPAMPGEGAGDKVQGSVGFQGCVSGGEGDFDGQLVISALKKQLRVFHACYERALQRAPTLQGNASIAFTITTRGFTEDVALIRSSLCHPAVEDCLRGIVERHRFNPGPEGGSVHYTCDFAATPD